MRKTIIIEYCDECPFAEYFNSYEGQDDVWVCMNMEEVISNDFDVSEDVHKDCPL